MTAVMGMKQDPNGKTQGKTLPQIPISTREEVEMKLPWLGTDSPGDA